MNSTCPFCQSNSYRSLYPTFDIFENHYEIVECISCKSQFLSPNPSADLLKKAYDDSYYGGTEEEDKFEGFIEKGLNYFRKQRAKKIAKLSHFNGRILDIGCGNGQFLKLIQTLGNFEIYGTEMPGSSAKRAQKIENINLKIGELKTNDFEKEQFDVITLFHVFEHLKEPSKYLDTISKILKPNGFLVMSFPNIDSWQAQFFKGKWLHLDPPRHLFFFKPQDFKALMKKRGYKTVQENYFSAEQNPYGAIQSWLNLFHKKRELLFESLKNNSEYTKETASWILKVEKFIFIVFTPIFILIDLWASVFKKGATVEFIFQKEK